MLKRRVHKKFVADINVVPYIDVMLVLLIIFMVTAPLLQQGVSVDLPQAQAQSLPSQEKEPIVVSVDKEGDLYLNIADRPNAPQEVGQLVMRLRAELVRHPERKVLVKGDQSVDYGRVMTAMVLVQQAGAPSVGLITQDVVAKNDHDQKGSKG
jgi:biopolymer transport protein TolR